MVPQWVESAIMSVFGDFQQVWSQRFPQSDLPDAWEEDIRANLEKHNLKVANLREELKKEEIYVQYLERLLADIEENKKKSENDKTEPSADGIIDAESLSKVSKRKINQISPFIWAIFPFSDAKFMLRSKSVYANLLQFPIAVSLPFISFSIFYHKQAFIHYCTILFALCTTIHMHIHSFVCKNDKCFSVSNFDVWNLQICRYLCTYFTRFNSSLFILYPIIHAHL